MSASPIGQHPMEKSKSAANRAEGTLKGPGMPGSFSTRNSSSMPPISLAALPAFEKRRPPPISVPFHEKTLGRDQIGQNKYESSENPTPVPSKVSSGTVGSRFVRPERVPIGTSGHIPLDLLGQPPSSFPTPNLPNPGHQARINAIGQASGVVGVANPILSEAIKASRVTKFSGKAEDFEDFERQWNFHLKLMHGASNGILPDSAVLVTLKGYLDEASATFLDGKLMLDPDLSYYQFWDELKSKFLRDARTIHRQNWRAIRLQIAGSRVTLQDWSKFQAAYVAKRNLVEDWSDAEDQQHVFSQVPSQLQSRVLQETGKRRNGKKWIRVVVPPNLHVGVVQDEIANELGHPPQIVSLEKRHFVVECANENEIRTLIGLDGSKLDGHVIKVQRAEYSMSGDEIFAYVRRLLDQEEELRLLRRSYGCLDDPPREVQVAPIQQKSEVRQEGEKKSEKNRGKFSPRFDKSRGNSSPKKVEIDVRPKDPPKRAPVSPNGEKKSENERKNSDPMICRTCQKLGKPCDHDFRKCEISREDWNRRKAERAKSQKTPSPPANRRE